MIMDGLRHNLAEMVNSRAKKDFTTTLLDTSKPIDFFRLTNSFSPDEVGGILEARYAAEPDKFEKYSIQGANLVCGNGIFFQSTGKSGREIEASLVYFIGKAALSDLNGSDHPYFTDNAPIRTPLLASRRWIYENQPNQLVENPHRAVLGIPAEKPLRRLLSPSAPKALIIKALYHLSELERETPGRSEWFKTYDATSSLELLQFLDELNLLNDKRFKFLAEKLRSHIFRDYKVKTYAQLRDLIHYSVIDRPAFWIEEELKQHWTETSSVYHQDLVGEEEPLQTTISLQNCGEWDKNTREILKLEQKVRRLEPSRIAELSPISVTKKFAEESLGSNYISETRKSRAARDARQTMIEKALLEAEMAKKVKQVIQTYARKYGEELLFLAGSRDSERQYSSDQLHRSAIIICDFFKKDLDLSSKTQNWFRAFAESPPESSQAGADFFIDTGKLQEDPLFQWLDLLKEPEARENLRAAVRIQPTEFYLLAKLMAFRFAQGSLLQNEIKFLLFTQNQKRNENVLRVADLFDSLINIAMQDLPSEEDIVTKNRALIDEKLKDLINPQRIDQLQQEMLSWYIRKTLLGNSKTHSKRAWRHGENISRYLLVNLGPVLAAVGITVGAAEFMNYHNSIFGNSADVPYPDRPILPESISPEQLARIQPKMHAEVIQLPDDFNEHDGAVFGFATTFLSHHQTQWSLDNPQVMEMTSVEFGAGDIEIDALPNQLVYRLTEIPMELHPFQGFRIIRLIQNGGDRPLISMDGIISWYESQADGSITHRMRPREVIVIAERIQTQRSASFSGDEYPDITFYRMPISQPYSINPNFEQIEAYLASVEGDAELESIITETFEEMKSLNLSDADAVSEWVAKYSARYLAYIREPGRFYALTLRFQNRDRNGNNLSRIIDNPGSGYYCEIAANAFREFWFLFGIDVGIRIGFPIRYFDGELWRQFGHATNVINFPNGMLGDIDTTPSIVEGKTPQADIDALTPKDPPNAALENVRGISNFLLGTLALSYLPARILYKKRKKGQVDRKIVRRLEVLTSLLTDNQQFNPNEQELLVAITTALNILKLENPEEYLRNTIEILTLLSNVDLKEIWPLVEWLKNKESMDQIAPSVQTFYLKNNRSNLIFIDAIRNAWHANTDGIRNTVPKSSFGWFDRIADNQSEVNIMDIPPEILTAFELSHLINALDVFKTIASIEEAAKAPIFREMQNLHSRRLLEQKSTLVRQVVRHIAAYTNPESQNMRYLAFVERANMPFGAQPYNKS